MERKNTTFEHCEVKFGVEVITLVVVKCAIQVRYESDACVPSNTLVKL